MADEEVTKLVKKLKQGNKKEITKEEMEKMLIEEKLKTRMIKDNLINMRVAINKYLNEEIKKI